MLTLAIVIITLALVFYTVGVWAEHIQRTLKWWHAGFFALGLAADTTGTLLMSAIAGERRAEGVAAGPLDTLMAVTGLIAIVLMAIHLVWAVIVLVRNRPSEKQVFHRFSLVVWIIWLVPYIAGAATAMM
ncbi:TIGR03987 family protein [Agromyces sp. CF514]|uniref:HsmA family protein n=1 Tax=Agromyces sp. CF514 TaxID=1881031 RepID=UPI0008F35A98|nr:HsmA family protein [Agromyces sp. CF514]SFR67240.1 TIGR03987 family protein [Agromyces sp. CF514]